MTPFSVQMLVLQFKENFKPTNSLEELKELSSKKGIFCSHFEIELKTGVNSFSEDVFDYAYNLFFLKKTFTEKRFNELLEEFLSFDFRNSVFLSSIFNARYIEFSRHLPIYFNEKLNITNPDDQLQTMRKMCDMQRIGGSYSWKLKTETIKRLVDYANDFS